LIHAKILKDYIYRHNADTNQKQKMKKQKTENLIDVTHVCNKLKREMTEEFGEVIQAFISKYTDRENPNMPDHIQTLISYDVLTTHDIDDTFDHDLLSIAWGAVSDAINSEETF